MFAKEHKSPSTLPLEELETILSSWFRQAHTANVSTDGPHLKEKALHVAAHLGVDGCRASNRWKESAKMADDVNNGIVTALDTIVNTTESSGNMKKELKQTIYKNVSNLRTLFMKLIETNNSNTREICELQKTVTNTRLELEETKGRVAKDTAKDRAAPSSSVTTEPAGQRDKGVGPSGGARTTLFSEYPAANSNKKPLK
jgi:hypothetical protein